MSLNAAILFALATILVLFIVAAMVEARSAAFRARPRLRHAAYTLALGVYCSSWTFYGAVGSAVRDGWAYLPIYLGPILLLLLAPRFLKKLSHAVAEEQATTVSDFIAARFGHDVIVARLVTIIALLGTIPYVALQFRSIGGALTIVSGQMIETSAMIAAAALLALFSILFAARRFELAGRSEGLLFAIGLESLIKISALLLVAAAGIGLLLVASEAEVSRGTAVLSSRFDPSNLSIEFGIISLISIMAIIVLPRQFYMGLAEAQHPDDLVRARFGLAAYLAIMAVVIIPIALAGSAVFDAHVSPDLYVLQLPMASAQFWLVGIALLGGIAAAASMVIVDSSALATMLSNDLFFPTVLRRGSSVSEGDMGRRMLTVRRLSIIGIILLALAWALAVSPKESLASIGLVAFAAMAQFTPHLILATNSGGRDPIAARASLATGLVLWLYTLGLPPILPSGWLDMLANTPFDPLRLFGIGQATPLVHGVLWSLGANIIVHALFAARRSGSNPLPRLLRSDREVTDLAGLVQLTASFVGQERAESEFPNAQPGIPVDRRSANRARQLIAGVVGTSSARALVASALAGGQMNLQDVTRLLDEGGQSLRFSRQLLAATFENIDAGISVVDADLNLVAWNQRYEELFDYPPGLVRVGVPVAELIRHNALRGDFGSGDTEHHVAKRLDHLRRRLDHSFERHRSDGRVIKTVGGPMPGGGYVMSFTDITSEAQIREELQQTLEGLEQRVSERTRALSAANRQLDRATKDKTRFLAAASHDLLQPLHAARLFAAALDRDIDDSSKPLLTRLDNAILAAEDLLRALLDISKIDAGGVKPSLDPLRVKHFLSDLAEGFRPMIEGKGLRLRLGPMPGQLCTDAGLLRSVMQNFLTNAMRYTQNGGIVVGVRRRGGQLRIDVIDSGVGIAADKIEAIFSEFTRLGEVEVEGNGLGLALCDRIVRLLGGRIEVRSVPGCGSRFSLYLPEWNGDGVAEGLDAPISTARATTGLNVLVVDNDPRIVEASLALLSRMGHHPIGAATVANAMAHISTIDAVLADYQLDNGEDGLTLIEQIYQQRPNVPAALITAEAVGPIRARADALSVPILSKPVGADAIAAFLAQVSVPEIEA